MAVLSVSRLDFAAAGQRILSDVTVSMAAGEYLALLGPSGCGKSTLLRLIAGFERATAGEIRLGGQLVSGPKLHAPPEARAVGMVFQSYALWPHMDVAGNVGYALRVRGLPARDRADRVAGALAAVGLEGFERRRVQTLSGGQRQRVALARCLAMRPRVMLLDEPLANLDAHMREAMVEEFRRLHRATGATIVHVTHDQAEAMALADRIVVMKAGRILQTGAPATLWSSPATADVARLLGRGQIAPVEVLEPGPPARVRMFDCEFSMRAPPGLTAGRAMACLRRTDLVRAPTGFQAQVEACRNLGATMQLAVTPLAAPECTLFAEAADMTPAQPGAIITLALRDGWVLPAASPGPAEGPQPA